MKTFFIVLSMLIIGMGCFIMGSDILNKTLPGMNFTEHGITDNTGNVIVDSSGVNGKTILSGIVTDTESTTIINMSNVIVPSGKKWVAFVSPLADMDIPAATTGKSIKWLHHLIGLSFGFTTSNPHFLPAGNYGDVQFTVNHYTFAQYSYTDETGSTEFKNFYAYYEVREISE